MGVDADPGPRGSHEDADGPGRTAGPSDDLSHVRLVDGEPERHSALAVDELDGHGVGIGDEALRDELEDLDERFPFQRRKPLSALRYGVGLSAASVVSLSELSVVDLGAALAPGVARPVLSLWNLSHTPTLRNRVATDSEG